MTERSFLFVCAAEPLVAAEAVWSTPTPIDLSVSDASIEARDTGAFACAGRPVRFVEEPLLSPRPGEGTVDSAVRWADALRSLYALDTRSALVVCHRLLDGQPLPALLDESWLLQTAEQIERHLPIPSRAEASGARQRREAEASRRTASLSGDGGPAAARRRNRPRRG
jgi:hypothetical protein